MTLRGLLVLQITAFLALPARPTVLGVVVQANRAHLNTTAVTTGATVYDGNRFSTEIGGWLRVRSGTATLELAAESAVSVRNQANGAQGMEVELSNGALVFSAARAASLSVIAREASIRPAADTRTVAQIGVTGLKELRVDARRGSLLFSYRGETETIAEGKSYRVTLDSPDSPTEKVPLHPAQWPKAFKIVLIGEVGAVLGLGIHELLEPESPDRP